MSRLATFALLTALASPLFALDDLPVYLDAGCDAGKTTGKLGNGYAQGPTEMNLVDKANGQKTIAVTCAEKLTGTDAITIKLPRKLKTGEYWDLGVKFADDRAWSLKKFADIRFWAKNKAGVAVKARVGLESASGTAGTLKVVEFPADTAWKEYVLLLSEIGGDTSYGVKFSQAPDQWGGADTSVGPLDLLVDSIRATDGTGLHALDFPAAVHNPRPDNWGPSFLLGSFDNRELGKSTKEQQAGLPYRYQYVMPDIKTYYSRSGKGYVYDYAMYSDTLGVKTAIVWYNLGKVGEGWDPVTANLADATYMTAYFDRYDWVLDQLALAGQSDYMIVFEPDMYGFLTRGPKGATGTPVDDPSIIPVDMDQADKLSGKTWKPTLVGWAEYLVWRARQKLSKGVIVGHMPNHWGVSIPGQIGQGRKEAHIISGSVIGRFLAGFGEDGLGDVVFVEKTDHDAGHKQADPSWTSGQSWFWDSTAYAKYFLWTRVIATKTALPICGWQVSEGNLTNTDTLLRDDAVQTFLAHPDWWIDGGFAGILFGAGNSDCANYLNDNDGGWFVEHMTAASKTAIPLPSPVGVASPSSRPVNGLAMVADRRSVRFEGFAGTARASFLDARGRVFATFSVHAGQTLDRSILPSRLVYVRLVAATGTRSFALLP
jgi:hypothetical protein